MKMKTNLSIYCLDIIKLNETLNEFNDSINIIELKDRLIQYIRNVVRKNLNFECEITLKEDFDCIFYEQRNEVSWAKFKNEIFNEEEKKFENVNNSLILIKIVDEKIFACTTGRGSNLVKKFAIKNFGIDLIPKIVKDTDDVIREVNKHNIDGNNYASQNTKRKNSNFLSEEATKSVSNRIKINLDANSALFNSDSNIIVNMGDLINILCSLDLIDLDNILNNIINILKNEDNFIVNNLIHATKKGLKKDQIDNELYNLFKDKEIISLDTIYVDENTGSNSYDFKKHIIEFENNKLESDKPFEYCDLQDFYNTCFDKKRTKKNIKLFFNNATISSFDENGEIVMYTTSLYNMININIIFNENCCILKKGIWYNFSEAFFVSLKNKFIKIIDNNNKVLENLNIAQKYDLYRKLKNEDTYNDSFITNKNVIKAHKTCYNKIEIADLIFWDDNNLYLMCNKSSYNAQGARDVFGQIQVSSNLISNIINNEDNHLTNYYEKLPDTEKRKIDLDNFLKLFKNKKIVYIAGFTEVIDETRKSQYGISLINDSHSKLASLGFDLLIINYKIDNSIIGQLAFDM